MAQKKCPECGCPITTETVCPECGCPIEQVAVTLPEEQDIISTTDFNEEEPYSPISPTSWWFRAPSPLKEYPNRGDFAKAHPFLGWLFNPWHVSYRGKGNRAAFNALNDLFLMNNLDWKLFLFPSLWSFFKLIRWIAVFILLVIFIPIILDYLSDHGHIGYDTYELVHKIWAVIIIVSLVFLMIIGTILYFCGWAVSYRRYISAIYDTFMRLRKRFALSIASSIKSNSINK